MGLCLYWIAGCFKFEHSYCEVDGKFCSREFAGARFLGCDTYNEHEKKMSDLADEL